MIEFRHTEDEVKEALTYISQFSEDKEFITKSIIVIDFIEDLNSLCNYYKEEAEKSANLLLGLTDSIVKNSKLNDKQRYIEKMKRLQKIIKKEE